MPIPVCTDQLVCTSPVRLANDSDQTIRKSWAVSRSVENQPNKRCCSQSLWWFSPCRGPAYAPKFYLCGPPSPLIAACRGARAIRPQKGDLLRAIADRKIEVKVQLNQLVANSPPLLAGQAFARRLLFPIRANVGADRTCSVTTPSAETRENIASARMCGSRPTNTQRRRVP
jgi:hypothetical protein